MNDERGRRPPVDDDLQTEQGRLLFTQFAVDRMADGVYWTRADASIAYVNDATCQMMGYSRDELLRMYIFDLNPDVTPEHWTYIWSLLQQAKRRTMETRHRAKDGRMVPLEVVANYFVFNGHEYSCSFTRDITERKQMELRLRESEKMRAIGQLAGGVAHDFNNQLAGISGCADLLEAEFGAKPAAQALLAQIHRAVKRSADLTSQLLAFSRQGKYVTEAVDLHDLAAEVLDMLDHSIDKRVRLVRRFDAPASIIEGDPSQLESALLNLAINARDAMPEGGHLTISTQNRALDQAACNALDPQIAPGNYVILGVTDTGQGMTPETMERMFEPFFTTKEKSGGTGLGLAAVYGTVRNHKGAITVNSAPGEGTRVLVYLPVSQASRPIAARPPQVDARLPPLRIMLVDDEEAVREVVRRMLESLDCQVAAFEDGAKAVEFFRRSGKEVDLVLLDLCMPGLSGHETFVALQECDPAVNVLLVSGYSMAGEAQALLEKGARGFLQKPYRRAELAAELAKHKHARERQ
ncbi:MAG TPA: response regulator [Polyangia bacterium]|nr:response regulator [Polyangia bacterium]